jgi:filamentous hemagglutinin family protein
MGRMHLRFLLVLAAFSLHAAPEGFAPIVGEATYSGSGDSFVVESHGDTIVHWDSFSIGPRESLYFAQDSPSSAILNRVIGDEPSDLLGRLESNGRVLLVNPLGIFIGPEAVIDTAAFLASTLDVLDQEFLERGDLTLTGSEEGTIVHLGTIHARDGDVVLCARRVRTEGTISAPKGTACIGAGIEWYYRPHARERLFVRARAPAGGEAALHAEGEISAADIALHSSNPQGPALFTNADLNACRMEERGGEVWLCSDGDTTLAGAIYSPSGKAMLLGERVFLSSEARVDLSSEQQGGELYVGLVAGHSPAQVAIVEKGAEISIRSREEGDGGQVLIWGETAASFAGAIDGRGGAKGGDGGFVEVSGAWVATPGLADLRASLGQAGTFLIDPTDVNITGAATTGGVNLTTNPVTLPASTPVTINNTDLSNQLALSNVTIDTASAQAASGSISVSANVSWATNTTLTLIADNQISVTATIQNTDNVNTGFTAMNFSAEGNGSGVSGVIRVEGTLSTVNGDIILSNTSGTTANVQGIYLLNGTISSTGSGDISLTGIAGGTFPPEGILISSSDITSSGTGSISLNGTGGTAASACRGVTIFDGSTVSTVTGDITITGTGGGQAGGGFNEGCTMELNATLETTGSGSITMNVSSSLGGIAQSGLRILDNSNILSSAAVNPGSITITGTASTRNNPYPNNQNLGVVIETNCRVSVTTGNAPTTINAILLSDDSNALLLYNGGGAGQGGKVGSPTSIGPITINTNSLVLQGAITSTGTLTIQPTTASKAIGIADGSTSTGLYISNSDLAFITNGFSQVTFGSATGTGAVDVRAYTFTDPILIRSPGAGGTISVNGALVTSGSGDGVTLQANGSGGGITLNSTVTTTGGAITMTGPVTLGATTTVDATSSGSAAAGGNISFSSTINAISAGITGLTLRAGTGGSVTFSGVVGGTTRLGSLTIDSAKTTANAVNISSNISCSAFTITTASPVTLLGGCTVDTNSGSGGNISFGGSIDGAAALTLTAGALGNISFGAVGSSTPLTSLTATGANITQNSSARTSTGNISYTTPTGTISLAGNQTTTSNGAISMDGAVTLLGPVTCDTSAGGGANISFLNTINGAQSLTLTAGTGTVLLVDAGGSTALTSLTASGATVTQSFAVRTSTGNITYTAGTISLSGNQTTTGNGAIAMNGPVTLGSSVTCNTSGGGGGNISFSSTINGAQSLTLTAGSGTVSFGAVGGSTRPTSFTVSGATINQNSEARVFPGNLSYTGAINLSGEVNVFNGSISMTGPVTLLASLNFVAGSDISLSSTMDGGHTAVLSSSSGTASFGAVGSSTPLTAFTVGTPVIQQNSSVRTTGGITYNSGAVAINGNQTTTSNGAISITAPVVSLFGPVTCDTSTGGGANISFSGVIDGAFPLALTAGSGTVSFGAVGNSTPLTSLSASGATINQNSTARTSTGNISYTGTTAINLSNNQTTTTGGAISMNGPVVLGGSVTCNTSAGNGNISFSSTVNGAQSLSLTAGGGAITLSGAVGGSTALTSLTATGATINQSSTVRTSTGNISYTGAVTLSGNQTTTSNGAILMDGPVTLGGSVTCSTSGGGGGDISFSSTINGAQTLALTAGNGTVFLFGAVGGSTALTSLTVTGATINQSSTVRTSTGNISYTGTTAIALSGNQTTTTNGAISMNGVVTLGGNVTCDTSSGGGGNISFSSTINGDRALSLAAGSGTISLSGAVGGVISLTSLTASGSTITQSSTVRTSTGDINYTGAISLAGNQTTTTNGAISMNGAVTLGNNITCDTSGGGGGNISFSSTVNGAQTLTLTAGSGAVSLSGAVGGSTALTSLTATGATINQSSTVRTSTGNIAYTGAITLAGNQTTTSNGAISMNGAVTLSGPVTCNTSGGGGANISFSNTINGAQTLTLTTGSGAISLSGAVGGSTALTSLTASGATINQNSSVRTSTGNINYTGAINLSGNQTTSSGAISMNGAVTLGGAVTCTSSGVGDITFSSTINGAQALELTASSAVVSFGAVGGTTPLTSLTVTGVMINQSSTVRTSTGNISYTGPANLSGNQTTTTGGSIAMNGPISLLAPITCDTSAGGGNISFAEMINGVQPLTLTAGAGTVSFAEVGVDAFDLPTSFTVSGATINQNGAVRISTGDISYTATTAINLSGNQTTTSNGAISMNGAVTLMGAVTCDTSEGGGANISFSSTVNGAQALVLTAGTGTVSFGAIGGSSALTSLTATGATINQNSSARTSSGNITYTGAINLSGNQTTTSNGVISMNGAVVLLGPVTCDTSGGGGANISFSSTVNGAQALALTAGTGTVSFGAVGASTALTSLTATGATINQNSSVRTSSGNITYTGAINLSGNQTTTSNGAISMNGAVALLGSVTCNTSAGGGANISFSSTINGAQTLALTAGTGTVSFGAVGASTALTSLTATGATINQNSSVRTSSGNITYTGAINLSGNQTTTNNGAISMNGAVALLGSVTCNTSAGGGANISFSSTINGAQALAFVSGTGTTALSGAVGGVTPVLTFSATGAGIQLGSAVYAQGGTIVFDAPVTLTTDTLISDSGTTGITFNSTVAGAAHDLTLEAPNGAITAQSTLDVATLTATCGEAATFNGAIETNGVVDIESTGNTVTVSAITSHGGTISLQPASGFSLDGAGAKIPNGILVLKGALDAGAGSILLSPTGRAELLSIATITGNPAGGNSLIVGEFLEIGANESVTVLGDVLWTLGNTAALGGDVIALNQIVIVAPTIELYLHEPGQIYNYVGNLYTSEFTHLIARDGISLIGSQTTAGPGAPAEISTVAFSSPDFELQLRYMGDLLDYALNTPPPPPPPPSSSSANPAVRREIAAEAELAITEILTMRLPIPWQLTIPILRIGITSHRLYHFDTNRELIFRRGDGAQSQRRAEILGPRAPEFSQLMTEKVGAVLHRNVQNRRFLPF